MTPRLLWCAVLFSMAVGACGEDPHTSAERGTATVEFTPLPARVSGLTLTGGRMHVDEIILIGNVPPPPPPGPGVPPPPPLPRFDLDLLSSGDDVGLPWLPQGLYSRVAFKFERVSFEGTWQGTPFFVSLDWMPSGSVSLRSPTPQELGPGMDVAFEVALDPSAWFAGGVLGGATISGGQILIDDLHNTGEAFTIAGRIPTSFTLP